MAKLVYACVRDIANAPSIKNRIESIIDKLVPDNIPDAKCKVVDHGEIIYGISTYTPSIAEKEDGVCMGMVYDNPGKWWKPMTDHPEGSYAIFRADEEYVEAITDLACSRAVWYYKDENVFLASTSQRAIINIAGKFELETRNIPWILSSGTLAPYLSWCKNIHFVDPEGSVLLNRKTWEVTAKSAKPEFPISQISEKEFQREMKALLRDSFSHLDVDLSEWMLPISGGYDSRGIACLLKEIGKDISKLDTITWGKRSSQQNRHSDGYLGGAAAKSLGMKHQFWSTDTTKEDTEKVFDRFIQCSEGRIDHIGGYSDGMAIWRNIFESGKLGVIRGDETFGGPHSGSVLRSRLVTGFKLCKDFSNLEDYQQYGFEKQVVPEHLNAVPGVDTPGYYRDRLYQQFRMPFTLSALSDIKYAYTEMLNPFLTKKIIRQSRTLPDHLRNNKILFAGIIDEISPKIPYATEEATNDEIIKTPEAIALFCREIGSDYMKQLFPEEFLAKILGKLQKPHEASNHSMLHRLKKAVSSNLPLILKDNLRRNMLKPALDIGMLAFRIYVTGRIYKMFTEDALKASENNAKFNGNNKTLQNTLK